MQSRCVGNKNELILFYWENQVEQLFGFLKRIWKWRTFHFCQNIILSYLFTVILIIRANLNKISLSTSMTLKFANFIHNYNLNTKFCNEIYRPFETIHYLIISFRKWSSRITKIRLLSYLVFPKLSLQIYIWILKKNGKRAITYQKIMFSKY